MGESVLEVSDATFEKEVLHSEIPVLVDFWAVWCGPCQIVAPFVENIAESHKGKLKVVKLNVDENMTTSSKYGVMSIPTLLLFKRGEVQETVVGALPQDKILERLAKHL